jgi:xylulokinase
MNQELLLGIDIGTQGTKGILCDLDGRILVESYREHTIHSPNPGWAEQDADRVWWGGFVATVKELLVNSQIDPARIAAVGCSAFVPAMLALDELGKPLRPAILYTDRRAEVELEGIAALLRKEGASQEEIDNIALASPIPQLLWVRENEAEVFQRTVKILQCQSYMVFKLTGKTYIDHAMKRSYAPMYDHETDGWSDLRSGLLGLDVSLLPDQIAHATELAGYLLPQAAEETGLLEGTPVSVGTADSFAEMVGAGVVDDGAAAAIYGSFTAILIGKDHSDDPHHGFHCLPGLYFGGAAAPTGASLTRWFRDQLGSAEVAQAQSAGMNVYELLSEKASSVPPGSEGLITLPFFTGEQSSLHPYLKRGAMIGLTTRHTRAHIYRSLLEGIALELRYQLEINGKIPERMNAVGGGSQSKLWTQIMSDVLNVDQHILEVKFGAAFGDAYLAGMAAGYFQDTDRLLDKWIRVERMVTPDNGAFAVYKKAYKAYCTLRKEFIE